MLVLEYIFLQMAYCLAYLLLTMLFLFCIKNIFHLNIKIYKWSFIIYISLVAVTVSWGKEILEYPSFFGKAIGAISIFTFLAIIPTTIWYFKGKFKHNKTSNTTDEVNLCLRELNNIQSQNSDRFIAFNTIRPQVVQLINNKEKTTASICDNKISHRNLVLLLITNVIADILPSGEYHIYRGTLNILGQDLLNLFNYAVTELEKSGFHSTQEAETDKQWIKDQIQNVG